MFDKWSILHRAYCAAEIRQLSPPTNPLPQPPQTADIEAEQMAEPAHESSPLAQGPHSPSEAISSLTNTNNLTRCLKSPQDLAESSRQPTSSMSRVFLDT